MEFEAYLKSKKIDPDKYKKGDEKQFFDFKELFDQMHENSFTQQKLFLINKLRRTYHFEGEVAETPTPQPKKIKPKIIPKKPKLS